MYRFRLLLFALFLPALAPAQELPDGFFDISYLSGFDFPTGITLDTVIRSQNSPTKCTTGLAIIHVSIQGQAPVPRHRLFKSAVVLLASMQ